MYLRRNSLKKNKSKGFVRLFVYVTICVYVKITISRYQSVSAKSIQYQSGYSHNSRFKDADKKSLLQYNQ